MSGLLTKSFELGYTYTRSTGPVIGSFLGALREGRITGTRAADGRVMVPALEYDPRDAAPLTELVDVAGTGVVTTWCWVHEPLEHHLLRHPFAFALIRLDGADVPMLHLVDAGSEQRMRTGMRVRARWAAERRGMITDIECFEPLGEDPGMSVEPVTGIEVPIVLKYEFTAGKALTRFLESIREGRLVGQRCPSCANVYVPPRGMCARCGIPTVEEVEVADTGVIEAFTIVHIPIPGNPIKPPFVAANILLDGSDMACLHRVSGVEPSAVRVGMRVAAVWKPRTEWEYSFENIAWFKPVAEGSPDA